MHYEYMLHVYKHGHESFSPCSGKVTQLSGFAIARLSVGLPTPLWAPYALMGHALMGPQGPCGPLGGRMGAAPLGPYGPSPCGPSWALVGRALVDPPGSLWAGMGQALVDPHGSLRARPL